MGRRTTAAPWEQYTIIYATSAYFTHRRRNATVLTAAYTYASNASHPLLVRLRLTPRSRFLQAAGAGWAAHFTPTDPARGNSIARRRPFLARTLLGLAATVSPSNFASILLRHSSVWPTAFKPCAAVSQPTQCSVKPYCCSSHFRRIETRLATPFLRFCTKLSWSFDSTTWDKR